MGLDTLHVEKAWDPGPLPALTRSCGPGAQALSDPEDAVLAPRTSQTYPTLKMRTPRFHIVPYKETLIFKIILIQDFVIILVKDRVNSRGTKLMPVEVESCLSDP